MGEPLVVEVTRGGAVESVHLVDAVVVDAAGVVEGWGDADRAVFARSALKPVQALPLLTTGAADATGLDERHLALACASHGGEPVHVGLVSEWLGRLALDVGALECGVHPPTDRAAADRLVAEGAVPDARHHNCSGKHGGFLTVCRHLGVDHAGYVGPDHPLQHDHVTPAIAEWCGVDLSTATPGVDGCGIPVWPVPLDRLAGAWCRLGSDPTGQRLLDAMVAHPVLMGATDRADSRLVAAGAGRVVVKPGAEGVACGIDRVTGRAFAAKVRDGGARAAEVVVAWLLARSGAVAEPAPVPVRNAAGAVVGHIRIGV